MSRRLPLLISSWTKRSWSQDELTTRDRDEGKSQHRRRQVARARCVPTTCATMGTAALTRLGRCVFRFRCFRQHISALGRGRISRRAVFSFFCSSGWFYNDAFRASWFVSSFPVRARILRLILHRYDQLPIRPRAATFRTHVQFLFE